MRFNPLSEEELSVSALAPEGAYYYKVIKSEEKISQAGNDYLLLVLKLRDTEGKEFAVFTNLSLIKLLKHFCDVNNMQDIYKSGDIDAFQCLNKNGGMVLIGVEENKPNPKGGYYPPKNIVKDYIVSPPASSLTPLKQINGIVKDDFLNDEIPF